MPNSYRDQAKHYQELIAKIMHHPLMPPQARGEAGKLFNLLGEWGDTLDKLKGLPNGKQSNPGDV